MPNNLPSDSQYSHAAVSFHWELKGLRILYGFFLLRFVEI